MKIYICAALACALAVSPALAQEAVPLKTLPFSPARQAGDLLFISGQIARTADGADVKESVAAEDSSDHEKYRSHPRRTRVCVRRPRQRHRLARGY